MWYEDLQEEWPEIFKERLVERKTFVNLSQMSAAVFVRGVDEHLSLLSIREKTLTYLHQLLTENKVKVGQWWGTDGTADEYLGTPDEIIERIRTEWNNTKEGVVNENPISYEMSIHIVLKENPWPVWR